jgi:positive regulator of sigma E activity
MARILNSLPRKFTLKLNVKFAMPISIEEHQVATISKVKAKSLVPSGVIVKIYPLFWILIEGYLFKMINNVIKDGYNSKEVNKMVDYAFI